MEKATKKGKGGRQSLPMKAPLEPWLERSIVIFSILDAGSAQYLTPPARNAASVPPSSMTLRERKKPGHSAQSTPTSSPSRDKGGRKNKSPGDDKQKKGLSSPIGDDVSSSGPSAKEDSQDPDSTGAPKKLPRVILHVRPPGTSPDV